MDDPEESEQPAWRANPPRVVAILVAHQGERWLPRVLESLSNLDYQPDEWIAVHDGTDLATTDLLIDYFDKDRVKMVRSRRGFGDIVATVLAETQPAEWYWLLHDDAAYHPDALAGLLDVATEDRNVGAVGPKVREWPSLKRLLEVGVSITSTGHREVGLEPGEPDAGQFDRPRDVLAVGTVGMLVRADAWDDIGGFDPELPLFGDDVDFGWRLNSAGWTVRTAPGSVVFHAEASRTGRRNRRGGIPARRGERRAAALYVLLANETPLRFWLAFVRLFFGSLLRTVGFALGKDVAAARREMAAVVSIYGAPWKLWKARRKRAATRRRPWSEINRLRPSFLVPYLHGWDSAKAALDAIRNADEPSPFGQRAIADEDAGLEVEPPAQTEPEDRRPWWQRQQWALVFGALLVLTLIADRGVLGARLGSDVLPATPESVSTWWSLIFSREHAVGLGSTSWPLASVVPLAFAGTITWFDPGLPVKILLWTAVPLSALTAHRFGRLLTDDSRARIVWAVSYGLLPAVSGAIAGGRVGTVLALVLMPVFLGAVWRTIDRPGWTHAMQIAITAAVMIAFAPILWWVLVPVLALIAYRLESLRLYLGAALVAATVLALPTILQRSWRGWRMWWEAGFPVPAEPSAVMLAFGSGGGQGAAPWWLTLPLIFLAIVALVPVATRSIVSTFWTFASALLVVGVIGSVVTFAPFVDAPSVPVWVGIPAALWLAVLMAIILVAFPTLRQRRYRRWAKISIGIALLFPLLGAGWYAARGVADPLTTDPEPLVPAYVAQRGTPTLVITGDVKHGVVARAVSGAGTVLGAEGMTSPAPMRARLEKAVGQIMVGPSREAVEELAALGVEAIHAPGVDPLVERRLDSTPGLVVAGSEAADSRVWMLEVDTAVEPRPRASFMRPVVAALWVAVWLVIAIIAIPYQHRSEEGDE